MSRSSLDNLASAWRIYVVPGAVFQSLMIGGGYGTGREVVEYFSSYGLAGGTLGLTLVTVCFAVLLAVSFEFARVFRAYDYRQFFRSLLGGGWIVFEVVYLLMFALVLAVIAAASGQLVAEHTQLSPAVGIAILLSLVVALSFYGRAWVTRVLAYKALILSVVFIVYFALILARSGDRISLEIGRHEALMGWVSAALRYTLYSSVTIPVVLFATREIHSRRQALLAGAFAAAFGVLPAFLLHLSFGAAYPEVLQRAVPTYSMIASLQMPALMIAYLVVLFGSLLDVGLGFVQSINERLDGWSLERSGNKLTPVAHAAVALICVLVSGALSTVGIVPLIAKGYGMMSYAFLLLFVGPLLTVGIYRLRAAEES